MNEKNQKIKELQERMRLMIKQQNKFVRELKELRDEVKQLTLEEEIVAPQKIETKTFETQDFLAPKQEDLFVPSIPNKQSKLEQRRKNTNLEKYIGENLVSKLGIIITIIGVVIGVKYSIENELISPLTRIILGYLMSIGLIGFGIKLKEKYENYSAVLVSGAIAIMYFITYAAHSYYDIFPQLVAFLLMVMFTIFTVIAAINYNKQIIAHIGLVGAYAVPFFLSNGSGNMLIFFSYITIINIGILAIAYQKYWKGLYYAAFAQSWLIYISWFGTSFTSSEHFNLAITFATIFFVLFYLTFLAYKVAKKEEFEIITVIVILINSFIFFGIGYSLLDAHPFWKDYVGLFTLANALIHFGIGTYINKQNLADKNLFYLIVGLVLVFITIAIPVQFDGNWVALLWTGEAALLFWIGRTKQVPFYEIASYALMLLSIFGISENWMTDYYTPREFGINTDAIPIFNIQFLSSILFIAAFAFMNKINRDQSYNRPFEEEETYDKILDVFLVGILILAVYLTFRAEIAAYFNHLYEGTKVEIKADDSFSVRTVYNLDLLRFKNIWLLNYSIAFLLLLSFIDLKKLKAKTLANTNIVFIIILAGIFLSYGIHELSSLHNSFFNEKQANFFNKNFGFIAIRYLSYAFFVALFFAAYHYLKERFSTKLNWTIFDLIVHVSIITVVTNEILNWLNAAGVSDSNTLIITIVWGVYSLMLIALGIWKKKQHLRIGAFVLLAITLLKLILVDIAHFSTIAKTIVLVSLGILLLIISFLYNKYKHLIFEEDKAIIDEK